MTINVAGVGAGSWGRNVIRVLSELDEVKLAAICDKDKTKKSIAREYGTDFYSSSAEMYRHQKELDLVDITTPTRYHFIEAERSIKNGIHTIVAKPLTDDYNQAKYLIRVARKYGVKLLVGQTERYNSVYKTMKEYVASGLVGKIISMHEEREAIYNPARVRSVGSVDQDLFSHTIDIMRFIGGAEVSRISVEASSIVSPYTDHLVVTLRFNDDSIGTAEVSRVVARRTRTFSLVGTKLRLDADCTDPDWRKHKLYAINNFPSSLTGDYKNQGELMEKYKPERIPVRAISPVEPLKAQLGNIINHITLGEDCEVNAERILENIKVISEIERMVKRQK
jgi:predicted dehydrogenase